MDDYRNLKSLRLAMGLNRVEFCEKFDIPYRTVSDWEAGRRKMPDYVFTFIKNSISFTLEDYSTNQVEFGVFCIENIAERLNLETTEIYRKMTEETDVLYSYVFSNFEVLHAQDKDYIIDDVISVLEEEGVLN